MNLDALLRTCAIGVHHVRLEVSTPTGSFTDKEYVVHFAVGGTCSFWLGGRLHSVRAGDLVLMPPFFSHMLRPQRTWKHYIVHFTLPFEQGALLEAPLVVRLSRSDQARMRQVLATILQEWQTKPSPARDLALAGLMAEVLALYVRNIDAAVPSEGGLTKSWKNVDLCLRVMYGHYREPLTLEDLAGVAELSGAYLCRAFKRFTGYSPLHFLNCIRIQKAKELLHDHQFNCTEIAERTGFASSQSFNKVFLREEGTSPLRWARQILPHETGPFGHRRPANTRSAVPSRPHKTKNARKI